MGHISESSFAMSILTTIFDIQPFLNPYSADCVSHLINLGTEVDLSLVPTPIVSSKLTENTNINERKYEKSFLGVRSFKCLITLLWVGQTLSTESPPLSAFNFILPEKVKSGSIQIYPQTVIFLATSKHLAKLSRQVESAVEGHNNLYFLPQIFLLEQLTSSSAQSSVRGYFICWYCGRAPRESFTVNSIQFSCSRNIPTCADEMRQVVDKNVQNGARSMWKSAYPFALGSIALPAGHADPFNRFSPSSLADAVLGFVLDFNGTWYNLDGWIRQYPHFLEASPELLLDIGTKFKMRLVPTGTTSRIKFITTSKVLSPKSSFTVYFAPFSWLVWVGLAGFVIISSVIEVIAFALSTQSDFSYSSVLAAICEFFHWKLSSLFGQYKHSSIPVLFPSQRSSVTLRVVVSMWLMATATVLYVYQAGFSAELALTFPFVTSLRHLTELDNFSLYLLVSDDLCKRNRTQWRADTLLPYQPCIYDVFLFPECRIIYKLELMVDRGRYLSQNKAKADLAQRLLGSSPLLCNSEESIHRFSTVNDTGRVGSAFITYDYEFQHNWNKFIKLMESNPSLKYANNMDADDDFGVTFTGYVFTDGLHTRISNRVIGRFELLMSSGIYWLWEKWERIRFIPSSVQSEGRRFRKEKMLPRALSFENSGTPWLFILQMAGLVIGALVFVFEKVNDFFRLLHSRN